MKQILITTKEQLDKLYKTSALTFEGVSTDQQNIDWLMNWLKENNALTDNEVEFYWIKGKTMNTCYNLSGDNSYPEDLNLLAIDSDTINQLAVTLPRFEIGGRWFDDIVDNNERRENR